MDSESFFKYLTFLRRGRVAAFALAFISLSITTIYFIKTQGEHRQTHWEFKHVQALDKPEFYLEPNITYKVSWDKDAYLYNFYVNGHVICLQNVSQYCKPCWNACKKYLMMYVPNPFRIKMKQRTNFGLYLNPIEQSLWSPFPSNYWYVDIVDTTNTEGMLITENDLKFEIAR